MTNEDFLRYRKDTPQPGKWENATQQSQLLRGEPTTPEMTLMLPAEVHPGHSLKIAIGDINGLNLVNPIGVARINGRTTAGFMTQGMEIVPDSKNTDTYKLRFATEAGTKVAIPLTDGQVIVVGSLTPDGREARQVEVKSAKVASLPDPVVSVAIPGFLSVQTVLAVSGENLTIEQLAAPNEFYRKLSSITYVVNTKTKMPHSGLQMA